MHIPLSPPPGPTGATEFAMAFTSTPRGARLARLFVSHCLDSWGHPYDGDVNETMTLITAELCANAARHGRVPGRDFHVRLAVEADGGRLRLEVSDTRAERRPAVTTPTAPDVESESGYGLLLVAALADDWRVTDRRSGPGKTVWAVLNTASSGRTGTLQQAPSAGSPRRPAAEPVTTGPTPTRATHGTDDAQEAANHERAVSDPS
ncbi:ATP-binding protein [Streptomyces sp. NPDC002769]|uniref:ATP-binding protein n=1 Tax=Streptomyces sp. NPDC002769 TaxID=3154542 RepID=UPI0033269517